MAVLCQFLYDQQGSLKSVIKVTLLVAYLSNIGNCKEHGSEASIYCQEPVHSRRRDEVADGVQVQEEAQNQEANGVLEEGEIEDEEDESIIAQRENTTAENLDKKDGTVAESEPADTKKYIENEEKSNKDEVQQLKRKHSGTTKFNYKGRVTPEFMYTSR